MDLEYMRTTIIFVFAFINTKALGYNFHVDKSLRHILAFRSLSGTIGLTSLTVGVLLIPLAVANIIYNTAVVWSAIFAWLLIGESLSSLQVFGLLVSLIGIFLITWANLTEDRTEVENSESVKEAYFSPEKDFIVGCLCCLLTAVGLGIVTVWTRQMQGILFSVIFFYYGLVASGIIGTGLLIEYALKDEPLRILNYSKE